MTINVQYTSISDLSNTLKKIKFSKYFKITKFFKIYKENNISNKNLEKKSRLKVFYEIDYISTPIAFKAWRKYNTVKSILINLFLKSLLLVLSLYFLFVNTVYILFSIICELFLHGKKSPLYIKSAYSNLDGISFIIPTWNKRDMVLNCVKLLDQIISTENKEVNCEILVVDNGSIDGTYQALVNLITKTKLIIIKNNTNLGYARAINEAVEKAKYNYVYLLNNDMEVQVGFLTALISYAKDKINNNIKFFGLTSQIFFFDPKKRREESGKTYCQPKAGFINVAHVVSEQNLTKNSITLYPGGGSSLINKHIFNKLGQYNYKSYTPLYCEDLDLGYLAWKFGYPSYFIFNSHVIHHHQSSTKKISKDPTYYLYKNILVFILKNYTSPKVIIKQIILFIPQLIVNPKYSKYALEAIKNMHNIFLSRLKLAKFKILYSDQQLENFILFESKYNTSHEE